MRKRDNARVAGLPDLSGIRPQPLFVEPRGERRNLIARQALLRRIRGEFLEMRGLSLTVQQAARLFGVSHERCGRILAELASEGLLRMTISNRYALRAGNP